MFATAKMRDGTPLPNPNELIGFCHHGHLCSYRAVFQLFLARLGKTDLTDPAELALFPEEYRETIVRSGSSHKIFLYDASQLNDLQHEASFLSDLQLFLGLRQPIPPIRQNATEPASPHGMHLNICDTEYDSLRSLLLEQAKDTATWMQKYFLASPEVTVSSEFHVRRIHAKWGVDPCIDRPVDLSGLAYN